MIEQLINYISHQPSDSTSPLFIELNKPAMLAAQKSNKVVIYDSTAIIGDTPYVKLSDEGERERLATFTNGGSYWEKRILTCKCVALGKNAADASDKAELLALAIEGFIKKLKVDLSVLPKRLDLGGTGSNQSIGALQIGEVEKDEPLKMSSNGALATKLTLIEVWVYNERKG